MKINENQPPAPEISKKKLLSYWKDAPPKSKEIFRKYKSMVYMVDILEDSFVEEFEELINDEAITETPEFAKYAEQFDDYHRVVRKAFLFADQMFRYLKGKLGLLLEKHFNENNHLYRAESLEDMGATLDHYMMQINTLVDHFFLGEGEFMSRIGSMIMQSVYHRYVYAFQLALAEHNYGEFNLDPKKAFEYEFHNDPLADDYRAGIYRRSKAIDHNAAKLMVTTIANRIEEIAKVHVMSVQSSVVHIPKVIRENLPYFKELLADAEDHFELPEDDDYERASAELFEEINEMSHFRWINKSERKFGDNSIHLMGAEYQKNSIFTLHNSVCYAVINLNNSKRKFDFENDVRVYEKKIATKNVDNNFPVAINRNTGELFFQTGHICLKELLTDRVYSKLKYIVYSCLFEYLCDKEDDKVEIIETSSVEPIIKEAKESIETITKAEEFQADEVYKYVPHVKEGRNEEAQVEDENPHEQKETYHYNSLKGRSGARVTRALDKILERISINGDHYKYRGKNGAKIPVPRSSGDVAAGTLKNALMLLGVTEEEFLANY